MNKFEFTKDDELIIKESPSERDTPNITKITSKWLVKALKSVVDLFTREDKDFFRSLMTKDEETP